MNINYIHAGDYLKNHHPIQFNTPVLSGNLWMHLADLNEQAQQCMEAPIAQTKTTSGIAEAPKAADPMDWTRRRKKSSMWST